MINYIEINQKISDPQQAETPKIGGAKHPHKHSNSKLKRTFPLFIAALVAFSAISFIFADPGIADGAGEDTAPAYTVFKNNFGGDGGDYFSDVAEADNGYVAVGHSSGFGSGDWLNVSGKGVYDTDAVIVKFDASGNVLWKHNFGGDGDDAFASVIQVSGGFVAVGSSHISGNGDWSDVADKDSQDAVIVKFDASGNVLWKYNFGGNGDDVFNGVTEVSGGFVAVGYSHASSFGSGDWLVDITKGYYDAILVKFDTNGNAVWKKNFGGMGEDYFEDVIGIGDGFVAVGFSHSTSFGNGDWSAVTAKGDYDAAIIKFDTNGNAVWKKNFGGSGMDTFNSITEAADDFVVAGYSDMGSFGSGDWSDAVGKGGYSDAAIVKFDTNGNVVWKKSFGGTGEDYFGDVIGIGDGFVAAGDSRILGTEWSGVVSKGDQDATIVKFDTNGTVVWKKNFGGSGIDIFAGVIEVSDGFVAAGYSEEDSFGSGDWPDVSGEGDTDAFIIQFSSNPPNDDDPEGSQNDADNGTDITQWINDMPNGTLIIAGAAAAVIAVIALLAIRRR